jgi:biopolymer transport protein ExbB/TolQ
MYEKIKSWISNNRFLVGLGVGAVLFLACYLFSRVGLSDNRSRTNDTGTKLEQAVRNQQEISAGITDSKGTADAIGSSIERSQTANRSAAEAVDRCTELVEETRKLTERNLEILATVRARGSAGDRSQD